MKRVVLFTVLVLGTVESRVTSVRNITENVPNYDNDQDYLGNLLSDRQARYNDLILALENEEWLESDKPCLDQIFNLLRNLKNNTLWAVWDWDAQSFEPQGVLLASRYQLGNFDQCLNPPWGDRYKELETKYCLADVVIKKHENRDWNWTDPYQSAADFIQYKSPINRPINEVTWGVCVPSSCSGSAIEKLLRLKLLRSHLGMTAVNATITVSSEECQHTPTKSFDGFFYAFLTLSGTLAFIGLICTLVNERVKMDVKAKSTSIVRAFCIRENLRDLFHTKKNGLEMFYGIKFITMCLITMNHQIGISNAGPTSNGVVFDQAIHSLSGLLIIHDDLFVDTFFLLSGFLAMLALAKKKKMPNPLILIFKRYVRLVIALGLVVFFIIAVFPYTGSGPLWNRVTEAETGSCRKTWWLSLLMVNNYIDSENICLIASWYIPCDFHFFVVTVLTYWVYKQSRKLGLACIALLSIASLVIPGVITYVYNFSAIQLFTFEFILNPRANTHFHVMYIKSHTRFAAYLIGAFSGYCFVKYGVTGKFKKISKKWVISGAVAALGVMLVVMLLGSLYFHRSYHPIEGAIYAAINRPVWACGLAVLVICCVIHVPFLKEILDWSPWAPLSKLTYGLYLTHTVIITRNVFATRNPYQGDYFRIANDTAGDVFWGMAAAFFIWVLAEAPANRLLTLFLPDRKDPKLQEPETQENGTDSTIPKFNQNHGFLDDNLNAIHYHSKM